MQEISRLMDDHEFRKELERIREHLDAISKGSNTVEVRRNYLISCVTVPSAKIYTPDQLRQIFDLTNFLSAQSLPAYTGALLWFLLATSSPPSPYKQPDK